MKIFLLLTSLGLSMMLQAQSFRWNDAPEASASTTTKAQVNYTGTAQVYPDYYDGKPTALGEIFYQEQMTGAHKKLPLGTIVKVTREDTGQSTTVRINDRGAYCDKCVIDLSRAAARTLGLINAGQTRVQLEVMGTSSTTPTAAETDPVATSEPLLTRRGVDEPPTAQDRYVTTAPPPNAYRQTGARITARTPVAITPTVVPPPTAATTAPTPKVQPKGTSTPTQGSTSITVIDVPISPFSVQLGAYGKYSNAERHVRKLLQLGFNNVFLLNEPTDENAPLHRVIIAPFLTREAAEYYVRDLAREHQIKGLVMQAKLIEVEE